MWFELVVGSVRAPRDCLRILQLSSLYKKEDFSIDFRYNATKCLTSVLKRLTAVFDRSTIWFYIGLGYKAVLVDVISKAT